MLDIVTNKDIKYFNPKTRGALQMFSRTFYKFYRECNLNHKNIVILCIGSDRATGDCLGPITGERLLSESHSCSNSYAVYGTLTSPVHAGNLNDSIHEINETIPKPYIVAIDASLGIHQHVGMVTIGSGNLCPGVGVNKKLPRVGDAHITGIVNTLGGNNHITLQTTHLATVTALADFIAKGIINAVTYPFFPPMPGIK